MSTLYVRNVPEDLYEQLRQRAAERGASISAETIRLLRRALRADRPGVRELLMEIEEQRPSSKIPGASGAGLVREGRERRERRERHGGASPSENDDGLRSAPEDP